MDSLVTNIFKKIKEPALLLNVHRDKVIVQAVNDSYTNFSEQSEEELIGKDFFELISTEDASQVTKQREAILRSVNNYSEEQVTSNCYLSKKLLKTYAIDSVETTNAWLGTNQEGGSFILHTVNIAPNLITEHAQDKIISSADIVEQEIEAHAEQAYDSLGFRNDKLKEGIFAIEVIGGSKFRFVSANKAFSMFVDVPETLLLGAFIDEIYLKAPLKNAVRQFAACILRKSSLSWEEFLPALSGGKTVIVTITPVFDAGGLCDKIIGSIHDVSNRQQIEALAKNKNKKLSKILESANNVSCTLGKLGRFLTVTNTSNEVWGYKPEKLIGKSLIDLLRPEDREAMKEMLSLIVNSDDIHQFSNSLVSRDGRFVNLAWCARWDADEGIVYCIAKDETEKQLIKEKLKSSEQRFKALIQNSSDLIAILDAEGNYLYVSPASKTIFDTAPEEYLGKNAFDFIHPGDKESSINEFGNIGKGQQVELAPFRFRHNDGSWRWVETVITDLSEDPSIRGFVANSRDITEKVNAQNDVLLSNDRYKYATMATSDAIWDWDLVTNKISWGDGFRRIFNWETCHLCSDFSHWIKLVHPDDLLRIETKLDRLLKSPQNQWSDEYRFAKSDDDYAIVIDRGFVVRDDTGKAIRMVGAMQDITAQRTREHRLKLFESVVTQTSELVMITEAEPVDSEGRKILYVNDAFCKVTGYTEQELIGSTPKLLHGENTNRKEISRLRKSLQKWESCDVCVVNYKKNGEEFWNNFTANPIANENGIYTHCISIGRDLSSSINAQKKGRLISSVSDIFNTNCRLTEALDTTMKLLTKWGKYNYSEIWLLDHDGVHLNLMNRQTSASELCTANGDAIRMTKVEKSQGFSGEVWNTGKTLSKTVVAGDNIFDEHNIPEVFVKTLIGIPLIYNKKLIGVLVLGSQESELTTGFGTLSEKFGAQLAAEIDRKQTEDELTQIFDFVPDIICISDFEGHFKKLSPAVNNLLGYTEDELLGRSFTDFVHPGDKGHAVERIESRGSGNSIHLVEERYRTKSGKFKWFALTSHAIKDSRLVFSVAKDITEKKNLEDLLARSNSLAKVGSWEINVLKGTVYWSDITREIREVDLDFEPNLETGIGQFRSDKHRIIIRKRVNDCIAHGFPWDEELEILTQKGNPKWVRSIGQAEIVDGKCIRIFGSFQDIDTRKRAELEAQIALKELEESERRYSDLFHLSPNPMWVYDFDTLQFLDVNEMALTHYGYTYEEFLKLKLTDLRQESEIPAMEVVIKNNKEDECQFYRGIFKHQKKNGEVIDVEVKSNLIDFKGQKAKLALINDITERQKYFNTLKKQNKILREISWVQSHVVRAPLSKLMGLVDLLGKHSMRNLESQTKLVENIEHCAEELDGVIREITAKAEYQAKLNKL